MPAFAYLAAARQAHLAARASVAPVDAEHHRYRARFWLGQARLTAGPRLP